MPVLADDLGAWLVAVLADAGRKRLAAWVFGDEQERALRKAADEAVELTSQELRPEGEQSAEDLARVVDQVFAEPLPSVALAGHATVLQALQAGVLQQLAILDDKSVTGTGRLTWSARYSWQCHSGSADSSPAEGDHRSWLSWRAARAIGESAQP